MFERLERKGIALTDCVVNSMILFKEEYKDTFDGKKFLLHTAIDFIDTYTIVKYENKYYLCEFVQAKMGASNASITLKVIRECTGEVLANNSVEAYLRLARIYGRRVAEAKTEAEADKQTIYFQEELLKITDSLKNKIKNA